IPDVLLPMTGSLSSGPDGPHDNSSSTGQRRIRDYYWRYRTSFAIGIFFLILTQALALSVPRLLRKATDAVLASDGDSVRQAGFILIGVAVLGAISRILSRLFMFNSGRKV